MLKVDPKQIGRELFAKRYAPHKLDRRIRIAAYAEAKTIIVNRRRLTLRQARLVLAALETATYGGLDILDADDLLPKDETTHKKSTKAQVWAKKVAQNKADKMKKAGLQSKNR